MAKTLMSLEANVNNTISTIAHRRRWQPIYVVRGDGGNRFFAAKWKLPPHRIATACVPEHMLVCQIDGTTSAFKTADGKTVHRYGNPGSVTFIPSGERALYATEHTTTLLELYISPALVNRFSEQHAKGGRVGSIRPFFAISDPWLRGYFQMLASEIETYGGSSRRFDSLLLGQAQQLLLGHLLRSYSEFDPAVLHELDRPKKGYALRPHLLRRVTDFIRADLAAHIHLRDLAELAQLSEAHFIRAFHAATGSTPYQFMLDERLGAGAELLRTNDMLSIAEIARSTGFRSQAHFSTKFKARYGMTPTYYRHIG